MLPTNVLYYGQDTPQPNQMVLRAGPLALVYENGDLRYITLRGREVLRRVYVAVRDRNWGTVPLVLSNEQIEAREDGFHISYEARHQQGEIDFIWRGTITGAPDGTITFAMDGEARTTFLRNRIGFCVLHPIREGAGARCVVEHADGMRGEGVLPRYIAPDAPFLDMRAIAHEVAPDVWAEVQFEGDLFEMEDQRNWIDASYKTFCTPLRLPYPVEVAAGTRIRQSVTLRLRDDRRPATDDRQPTAEVETGLKCTLASETRALPQIGLGAASHGQPLSNQALERLRTLNLAHLRVDLRLSDADVEARLRQAHAEAWAIGARLEVALFLSEHAEEELRAFRALLDAVRPDVLRWLVFHMHEKSTSAVWVQLARTYLEHYDAQAQFASGSNAYFTQLNRERPPTEPLDLLTYSVNPQVHAFDNASLVETPEAIAATIESAKQFSNGRPVIISPVTLRPRFNPDATGPEREPGPGELPAQVDARQMSLLGAGWTLASLKYSAEHGAASVTYYETTGWRGVMETADGSPSPFRSLPGMVFPMYHLFADVGEFAGGEVIRAVSNDTLRIEVLALRHGTKVRVLLANMTHLPHVVQLNIPAQEARVRILDETAAEAVLLEPERFRDQLGEHVLAEQLQALPLQPYALARVDFISGDL